MGVLPCNRIGCENIMCDFYSPKYGYICWECRNQLLKSRLSIAEFMSSDKAMQEEPVDRTDEINRVFRERKS